MLDALLGATRYHGAFPHFIDGASGATIPMSPDDDAADLVETSFLVMGLLCARQYFTEDTPTARRLRDDIDTLWRDANNSSRPAVDTAWQASEGRNQA